MTTSGMTGFADVDELLSFARSGLHRYDVSETVEALARGARLVDIRPQWQRAAEGEIPGSVIVERNHLEWRLHPASGARIPLADITSQWIVLCSEGYTSSLAAHSLLSIGVSATDLIGGFHAWANAGLPTARTVTAVEELVH